MTVKEKIFLGALALILMVVVVILILEAGEVHNGAGIISTPTIGPLEPTWNDIIRDPIEVTPAPFPGYPSCH